MIFLVNYKINFFHFQDHMDIIYPFRVYRTGFRSGLRVIYNTNYEIDGTRNRTPGIYVSERFLP